MVDLLIFTTILKSWINECSRIKICGKLIANDNVFLSYNFWGYVN